MSTHVISVDDGYLVKRLISAATTNATIAKNTRGRLMGWAITNINAAVMYVKIYDKATSPTVGTDVPVLTLAIPGSVTGAGTNWESKDGITFFSGIGFAITVGSADNDTTAVAASDVIVNLMYK